MGEMATGERGAADVVKAVGAVIALLAGSVALLYIAGGAAMTLRLFLLARLGRPVVESRVDSEERSRPDADQQQARNGRLLTGYGGGAYGIRTALQMRHFSW